MKICENMDLKGKFITITLIVSLTGLSLVALAFVVFEYISYRHNTADALSVMSRITGNNVTAAILFDDRETAAETLSALRAEESIVLARIITLDKQVFASYRRGRDVDASTTDKDRMRHLLASAGEAVEEVWEYGNGLNIILQPVLLGREHVGWVYVEADNRELVIRLKWIVMVTVGVLLLVLIPVYVLSSQLRHVFLAPIQHLAGAMDKVTKEKDYSVRVQRETGDELGDLVDGFNDMLEEIRKRDVALREHGQELEGKVKLRTAELEQSKLALEMTVEELSRAKEIAEAANVAKSNFLASMSHELRTPLNAVIGFSEVLLDGHFGPVNEQQREYLGDILASGQHLLALISDILDIAKIEAGRDELKLDAVNVPELIDHSLVMIREKAHKHRIAIDVVLERDMEGLEIAADQRKLKQILFNLLSNAAKFTPDKGRITVSARRVDGEVLISVADSGIGIAKEELEKIFEEFYQTEGGLANKTPGTGLGLALARRFVELHGGRIWADSRGPGQGSRFTFTMRIDGDSMKNRDHEPGRNPGEGTETRT